MHNYKHDNSSILGSKKTYQDSQTRSQAQHIAMMNTAPGMKQYKAYLMNQEEVCNRNASVFEAHIIPEDESDKSQDDDDLSFQPPDPIQAINNSETSCRTNHPTKKSQKTYNKLKMMQHPQEYSLWNYRTQYQMIENKPLLMLKTN